MNVSALTTNAMPRPAVAMITPAAAGPAKRDRLKTTELRAMAEERSARGTRDGTMASRAGRPAALMTP